MDMSELSVSSSAVYMKYFLFKPSLEPIKRFLLWEDLVEIFIAYMPNRSGHITTKICCLNIKKLWRCLGSQVVLMLSQYLSS